MSKPAPVRTPAPAPDPGPAVVRPGVLGQAALALADGFARVLLEKGLIDRADYVRGFDLAVAEWEAASDHPQQAEVLGALRKIHPGLD